MQMSSSQSEEWTMVFTREKSDTSNKNCEGCFETEKYFFSENIYLNKTEDFANAIVRAEDNNRVIRSQSSKSKKKTWISLLDQISPSAS